MRTRIFITAFFALIITFTSCNQNMQELKEQVDKFNKTCPLSFGDVFTINSVSLDKDAVDMKFSINETNTPVSLLNNHKEELKETLSLALTKENSENLVDKTIAAKVNLRITIVGVQTGERVMFEYTPTELTTARFKYSLMTEDQKLLASRIFSFKIRLPIQVDDITTLKDLSLTSDFLVYKYEINDIETGHELKTAVSFMKMFTMSQMSSQIAGKDFLANAVNKQFYQALINCNQGIKCDYYERRTRNTASFEISVSEIKDVLSGKWQKDAPTMEDWENFADAVDKLEEIFGGGI